MKYSKIWFGIEIPISEKEYKRSCKKMNAEWDNMMDSKDVVPPYLKFPNEHRSSIFWRMGYGESYLMVYEKWFNKLTSEEKEYHIKKYSL